MGYVFIMHYFLRCHNAEILPFNGSIILMGLASIFFGAITTCVFLFSVIVSVYRILCDICSN